MSGVSHYLQTIITATGAALIEFFHRISITPVHSCNVSTIFATKFLCDFLKGLIQHMP